MFDGEPPSKLFVKSKSDPDNLQDLLTLSSEYGEVKQVGTTTMVHVDTSELIGKTFLRPVPNESRRALADLFGGLTGSPPNFVPNVADRQNGAMTNTPPAITPSTSPSTFIVSPQKTMTSSTPVVSRDRKNRKNKDLPDALSKLTEVDFRRVLHYRLETDEKEAGEVMVAYKATWSNDDNPDDIQPVEFDLEKLNLDQLRMLCKNVGIQYVNKCTRFQCRKALWILANHQEQRERLGEPISTVSERASNNIIRLTNVIFSHHFLESFLKLNDIKTRTNHESGGLPSDFWTDVADALNGASEDDDSPLKVVMSEDDPHFEEIDLLDLEEFDQTTPAAIRKKFNLLLKVRRVMKTNMTTSGEHGNDAYEFVDVAMKTTGGTGLTKIGCYYFFVRCQGT